jgi:hypothetical protein
MVPSSPPLLLYDDANDNSGFCSREQIYRPDKFAVCCEGLIGGVGSGFWEDKKGVRNKVKTSRNDPRKYNRR